MSDAAPDRNARGQPASSLPLGRSAAEWTTLLISLLIIGGLVGLVVWLSLHDSGMPPRFTVAPSLDAVRRDDERYALPVIVTNLGGQTAREVRVVAELQPAGAGAAETAEFTIDVLASGESQEGTVLFDQEPASQHLAVAVESFR